MLRKLAAYSLSDSVLSFMHENPTAARAITGGALGGLTGLGVGALTGRPGLGAGIGAGAGAAGLAGIPALLGVRPSSKLDPDGIRKAVNLMLQGGGTPEDFNRLMRPSAASILTGGVL